MRKLLTYPSIFDLALIIALYIATKSVVQDFNLALAGLVIVVILRFILEWMTSGVILSRTRNWYIKQIIYMFAGISVVYIYSFQQFAWVFATYLVSASFIEVVISITMQRKKTL